LKSATPTLLTDAPPSSSHAISAFVFASAMMETSLGSFGAAPKPFREAGGAFFFFAAIVNSDTPVFVRNTHRVVDFRSAMPLGVGIWNAATDC